MRAYRDDEEMRVSHETIYQSLYGQSRGALRKELWRSLRTGRAVHRPQGRAASTKGKIRDMVMISERPAEVEDRAVPGHWEGDLIIGTSKSAIGTLVERHSRYVMLFLLPDDSTAESVRIALTNTVEKLPEHLWKSLTWDQGTEMTRLRSSCSVCDQRGHGWWCGEILRGDVGVDRQGHPRVEVAHVALHLPWCPPCHREQTGRYGVA
jgi:IS30 family transposase